MIIETKEIYKCEHCRKLYQRPVACKVHEIKCNKNPDNDRACLDCLHSIKKSVEAYPNIGEGIFTMEVVFCEKKNTGIYPIQTEHKGNYVELVDYLNKPMPKTCKDQYSLVDASRNGDLW